jgi:uncharacterized damage-inducible protein DinB
MTEAHEMTALFKRDITRVIQQLQAFPDDLLWNVAPGVTNTAGNLVLHLEGNLREYIGRQLGNVEYQRKRDEEFSGRGASAAQLITRMEAVRELVIPVVASLSSEALTAAYPESVLGGGLSTRQFLMHLLGHLNYHLGQIDYLRRMLTASGSVSYVGL